MGELIIGNIKARKILDSRGNPTIEVETTIQNEAGDTIGFGSAAAPSGASRGVHEVTPFSEGSVDKSIEELSEISEELKGTNFENQASFDEKCRELDGTSDLSKVGGNAIVALSMSIAKAAASAENSPLYRYLNPNNSLKLPYPLGNVLGGGEHAGPTSPDIQEFLVLPVGAEGFQQAAFANAKVHGSVEEILTRENSEFSGGKSDEGAWTSHMSNMEALDIVSRACEKVSDEIGFEIRPGLDIAASGLYDEENEEYVYSRSQERRSVGEQIEFVLELIDSYNLIYVEDPIWEEDFESFSEITGKAGENCLICGDDLFVTNVERIERGIEAGSANSVLIKPNQIGTLSDTKKAIELTKESIGVPVISHRSGETTDATISHLAVGFSCPIIKTGVVGGERIAKLNELIRIEEEIGEEAQMGEI